MRSLVMLADVPIQAETLPDGREALVCGDTESMARALALEGAPGDAPNPVEKQGSSSVFDIDSIGLIKLLAKLNQGVDLVVAAAATVDQALSALGAADSDEQPGGGMGRSITTAAGSLVSGRVINVNVLQPTDNRTRSASEDAWQNGGSGSDTPSRQPPTTDPSAGDAK